LAGRDIAVIVDEEHRHPVGQLPAFMWIFDVSDLGDLKPLATFHVSEADSPFSRTPEARFGAHQCQEHINDALIYVAWFSGGLRVVDIADPLHPVEAGFFIPEPGQGAKAPQSNDVDVDEGYALNEQLLEKYPNHPALLDTKGWALYKKGQYEEALALLNQAWENRATYNNTIYQHLLEAEKAVESLN